jgi:hypothetical protein
MASTGLYKYSTATGTTINRIRAVRTDIGGTPIFNHSYKITLNNIQLASAGFSMAEDSKRYVAVGTVRHATLTAGGADVLIMQIDPANGNAIVTNKVDMDMMQDVANCVIASKVTANVFYICGENFTPNGVNPTSFIMRYNAATNNVDWVRRFNFSTAGVNVSSSYYSICEHTTTGNLYACGKIVPNTANTNGLITKISSAGGAVVHRSYDKYSFEEFRSIRPSVGKGNFVLGGNCKTSANDPNTVLLSWMDLAYNISAVTLSTIYDADYCYDALERKNTASQYEYYTAGKTKKSTLAGGDFEGSTFKLNITSGVLQNFLYGDSRDDNFYAIDYFNIGTPTSDGLAMFGQYTNNLANSWTVKAYFNGETAPGCIVEKPASTKVSIDFTRTTPVATVKDVYKAEKLVASPDKHRHVFLCTGTNTAGSNALVQQTNDDVIKEHQLTTSDLTVYPNPMDGNTDLNIVFEMSQQGEATIQLFDSMGRLLKNNTMEAYNGNNQTTLDMSDLPKGSYIVRLLAKDVNLTRKVIK